MTLDDLSLGPVANPDGSPTDVTRAMLADTGRDPDAFAAAAITIDDDGCGHVHRNGSRCGAPIPAGSRWYCGPHGAADPCRDCALRVRVTMTVFVDVDDYRMNYGSDDLATIRSDVKAAVRDAVATGAVLADGIIDVD